MCCSCLKNVNAHRTSEQWFERRKITTCTLMRTLLQQIRQRRPSAARFVHLWRPPLAPILDEEDIPQRRLLHHPAHVAHLWLQALGHSDTAASSAVGTDAVPW